MVVVCGGGLWRWFVVAVCGSGGGFCWWRRFVVGLSFSISWGVMRWFASVVAVCELASVASVVVDAF